MVSYFMKSSLSVRLILLLTYVATIILHEEERDDFSEIQRLRANVNNCDYCENKLTVALHTQLTTTIGIIRTSRFAL